jgi:hypothetical protein
MEPSVTEQLKTLNMATITDALQGVAASWARIAVDHLPARDKTLTGLQAEYRDLLESMPVAEAGEIEPALRQFVRGLRLKGDQVSATQRRFLEDQLGLRPPRSSLNYVFSRKVPDDTYGFLKPIFDQTNSLVKGFSLGAVLYVAAHRSLGALFPTFTKEFRDRLCDISVQQELVNEVGCVELGAVIKAHSRWIARILASRSTKALTLSGEDVGDYGEYADTGSWLDDQIAGTESDAEDEWEAVSTGYRYKKR